MLNKPIQDHSSSEVMGNYMEVSNPTILSLDHSSSDKTGNYAEASSQTILNLDRSSSDEIEHSSQSSVLNSVNVVANRSSNRIRRTPVTRNKNLLW
jgi:hypothetical protein